MASLLGLEPGQLGKVSAERLHQCGRNRLLAVARVLGVAGLSRTMLADIVARLHEPVRALRRPARRRARRKAVVPVPAPPDAQERAALSKFEFGGSDAGLTRQPIPWGYGRDRITAMVVDPDRMYAYWELTDDSVEAARRALGNGGSGAWVDLRFYDVTGRTFDGTNAHEYFDVKVERTDRQWFVNVGRPASSWCVEVGMKSSEGYFRRIARSGRVDFPRSEPAPPKPVQWMTVRARTGEVFTHPAADPPLGGSGFPSEGAGPASAGLPTDAPRLIERQRHEEHVVVGETVELLRETVELLPWEEAHEAWWKEWTRNEGGLEWADPVSRSRWEAGPFPVPVETPRYVEERWGFEGPARVEPFEGGSRVTYGPWRLVIRGVGAHAERQVLATWHVETSWVTSAGFERGLTTRRSAPAAGGVGASEWAPSGASERAWLAGSERRLSGASERFRLGASERRLGGASEMVFRGASERPYRGASERRILGASERRMPGASERGRPGGSEVPRGRGERLALGASELRHRRRRS